MVDIIKTLFYISLVTGYLILSFIYLILSVINMITFYQIDCIKRLCEEVYSLAIDLYMLADNNE